MVFRFSFDSAKRAIELGQITRFFFPSPSRGANNNTTTAATTGSGGIEIIFDDDEAEKHA